MVEPLSIPGSMDLYEAYLTAKRSRRLHPHTLVNLRQIYRHHGSWCADQGVSPEELTPDLMSAYFADLADQGYAPRTMKEWQVQLKAVYDFAVYRRRIESCPIDRYVVSNLPKTGRRVKHHYTMEDLHALRDIAVRAYQVESEKRGHGHPHDPGRYARMLYLYAYTGLRRSEGRGILWDDINFKRETIHLRPEIAKQDNERIVPLHPRLAEMLVTYGSPVLGRHVLSGWKDGKAAADGTLQGWLEAITPPGMIAKFHSFRRTFANNLYQHGVQEATIKAICGWSLSGDQMFDAYVNVSLDTMREGIAHAYQEDPL